MFAFDTMNYSLRPNKAIQRQMVFDALELLAPSIPIRTSKYIGFGSVWFADFALAHKRLGVEDMLSIERDEILYKRAVFNAPFRTVRVAEGDSTTVLEALTQDENAMSKPWIVWLDYTSFLTEEVVADLNLVADRAPPNSVVIVTLNVSARSYGAGLIERRAYLRERLGGVVPEEGDNRSSIRTLFPVASRTSASATWTHVVTRSPESRASSRCSKSHIGMARRW